jgi:flagellar hook-length control protein FliK
MTVPINIPIITTSPPSIKSAKSFIIPEKAGDFEQILKQKTSENSQVDNGITPNDPAVKIQPKNNVESEVKSTKEDTKSEKIDEEKKPTNTVNENAQPQLAGQVDPTVVPNQEVTVLTLNSTSVDQTKQEKSSETKLDQMGDAGIGAKTPGEPTTQQILPALSALQGEQVMNSIGNEKISSKLHTDAVEEAAGNDTTEVKGFDQSLKTQGNDPSISQIKPNSNFEKITQSLSPSQNSKIEDQVKASVAPPVNESAVGTKVNLDDSMKPSDLVSTMIEGENASKPGQSSAAKEKGFTASTNVGQDADIKSEMLSKTDGQPAAVSTLNNNLGEDVKKVAEVKGINNTDKSDRKMVPETPPDPPDKAPPALTPGEVTDRMKADPFTGKINEPARLAEAQSTEILRQISRQVAGSPNSGSQTIRIQLHPEDLGQIELRITSSSQGTHVSLIADQAGTGKLLETHVAQLKQTLSDAGVQMADVHVGQQAQQQSFRDPQSSQNPQQKNFKYDGRTVIGSDEIASNRSHPNSSLVDYRI